MKDARVPRPRRGKGRPPVPDVMTPTERQAHLERVAERQRLYFRYAIPALGCTAFGFFVPAPTPIRLAALVLATMLGFIAVLLGNAR